MLSKCSLLLFTVCGLLPYHFITFHHYYDSLYIDQTKQTYFPFSVNSTNGKLTIKMTLTFDFDYKYLFLR